MCIFITCDKDIQTTISQHNTNKERNIVAAIGNIVDDSPTFRQSNFGAGSEIARETADTVLIENSIYSIVQGIWLDQAAFDDLNKGLIYVLPASSFSDFMPALSTAFLGLKIPLISFLMIVICCRTVYFLLFH
jgi:sodium/potassium-transporting ATPase subunit alpha